MNLDLDIYRDMPDRRGATRLHFVRFLTLAVTVLCAAAILPGV